MGRGIARRSRRSIIRAKLWLAFFVVSAIVFGSCDSLVNKCELNDTGTFFIDNESGKGQAYKILIDGVNYGIVGAGQTKEWELAAGPHVVQILFAETGNVACSVSAPTVIKCKKTGLKCSS